MSRTGGPRDSLREIRDVAFDYLSSLGAQTTWVRTWKSPASAPLAVRVRLTLPDGQADTLLIMIGPRG